MALTTDEIVSIGHRIRRAGSANCWTGTSGSIAADAKRLMDHIQETAAMCEYPSDHILRGEAELKSTCYLGDEMEAMILTEDDAREVREETGKAARIGDGETTPKPETAGPPVAVRLLETAMAAVLDRHRIYGPPEQHFARTVGMINSLFSAVLRRPLTTADWARIMLLDKLARDLGPRPHPDNAVDLAGYSACLASCLSSPPAGTAERGIS